MCVAGALNDTLCVWRVRDGTTVCESFPELITALQWKPRQRDSETPLLVVGLVGGELVMVEVMGARVNMTPSLQLTRMEHFGKGEGEGAGGSLSAGTSVFDCFLVFLAKLFYMPCSSATPSCSLSFHCPSYSPSSFSLPFSLPFSLYRKSTRLN